MNPWPLLAGAACVLLGSCLGFAVATKVDVAAEAKWWDLMTAFGTVGAVLGAVGIALWQRHVAHHLRLMDAKFVLAEAYPRFSSLRATCETAKAFFDEMKEIDRSPEAMKAMITKLEDDYLAAEVPKAVVLSPLGVKHATDLAVVNSQVQAVIRAARRRKWADREDRANTAVFVVRGLTPVIPSLKRLGEAGHTALQGMLSG